MWLLLLFFVLFCLIFFGVRGGFFSSFKLLSPCFRSTELQRRAYIKYMHITVFEQLNWIQIVFPRVRAVVVVIGIAFGLLVFSLCNKSKFHFKNKNVRVFFLVVNRGIVQGKRALGMKFISTDKTQKNINRQESKQQRKEKIWTRASNQVEWTNNNSMKCSICVLCYCVVFARLINIHFVQEFHFLCELFDLANCVCIR